MGLFATLSYYALLILIPFLVIPFSRAATIVIIIEIFWFVVFHKYSLIDTTLGSHLTKKAIAWRCSISFVNSRNRTSSEYIGYALSIFLFFRPIVKKNLWKTCLFYQTKSRFYLELDSKIQASKDIVKEKEHRRIFSRRNYHQSRLWIHLVVGCYWA